MANNNPYANVTMAQLGDPTLRNLLLNDLSSKGNKGTMVADQNSLMERELETAKEGISAFGEAERIKMLPLIEQGMQKRGLVSSGDTTRQQLEKSEEVRLRELSTFSDAQKEVLARYGGYGEAEKDRASQEYQTKLNVLGGLEQAQLGSGTQLQIAGIEQTTAYAGMNSQEKIAFASMGSQEKIATLQAQTQKEIAKIEQDTSLTVADKQVKIAAAKDETDKVIANIGAQTSITTTGMTTQTQLAIAQKQAEASLSELTLSLGADRDKYLAQIKAAKEQGILEDSRIRDITTQQIEAEFKKTGLLTSADKEKWSAEIDWAKEKGLMDNQTARDLAANQIRADLEKTGLTLAAGKEQYLAELKWAKEKGYLDNETAKTLSANQIAADLNKTGLMIDADRNKYTAELEWAKTKGLMDDKTARDIVAAQIKGELENTGLLTKADAARTKDELAWAKEKGYLDSQTSKDIVMAQIKASYQETDLTSGRSLQAVKDQLQNAKDMQLIDNRAKLDLQKDYLLEQARQFDVKDEHDMDLAWASHGEAIRQFDLTNKQNYDIALETLKLNRQSITDNELGNRMNLITTVMSNPLIANLFTDENGNGPMEEFADIVYDMLATDEVVTDDALESGDPIVTAETIANDVYKKMAEILRKKGNNA
jgi:hypothetical protein